MPLWYDDNALSIGRASFVGLNRATEGAPATALAKIAARNPASSVNSTLFDARGRAL